jgi:hypothetical protein
VFIARGFQPRDGATTTSSWSTPLADAETTMVRAKRMEEWWRRTDGARLSFVMGLASRKVDLNPT